MKSVLISIQPKWCELIASGKKTVEVRKTRPKIETPFKCYIYETLGEKIILSNVCKGAINRGCGKVIGEFVCDKIDRIGKLGIHNNFDYCYLSLNEFGNNDIEIEITDIKKSCISKCALNEYGANSPLLYAWHISDLVIYDKPRELSEFKRACPDNVYDCAMCRHSDYTGMRCTPITRPPQSWLYVEVE